MQKCQSLITVCSISLSTHLETWTHFLYIKYVNVSQNLSIGRSPKDHLVDYSADVGSLLYFPRQANVIPSRGSSRKCPAGETVGQLNCQVALLLCYVETCLPTDISCFFPVFPEFAGSKFHSFFAQCVLVAQSCSTLCDPLDCSPIGSSVHGILQNIRDGCHFLLQGIFPTQGLNPRSSALQADSLLTEPPGKPSISAPILPLSASLKSAIKKIISI